MNPFRLISAYRTQLMALATLAVLFTHLPVTFETFALARLKLLGIFGVDVFFFVSGFGLYYSFLKDPMTLRFYGKRLRRILPPFLALLVLHLCWSGTWSWTTFLHHASTLGFWIPTWKWGFFGWYVSAILVCYLLFPSIFFAMKRRPVLATIAVTLIGLALCGGYAYYYFVLNPGKYNALILFFGRIPVFVLGAFCGHLAQRTSIPRPCLTEGLLVVAACLSFLGVNLLLDIYGYTTMRNNGLLFLLPALIVPGTCLALARLLSFTGKHFNAVLIFIGTATLEAYLLLGDVFSLKTKVSELPHISNQHVIALILMVLCVLLAWLCHKFINIFISLPARIFRIVKRQ